MGNIIYLLIRYRYFLLFPLSIIEGPVITIVAGFLCSLKIFNPFIVYPILILGDNIGDSLYFFLGRYGKSRRLTRIIQWLGLTPEKLEKVKMFIGRNPNKTISLSKIILGIGVAGLFMIGKSRIKYKEFLKICFLTSILQCLVYLSIGWFFGLFYLQISRYLDYFASISIIITLAIITLLVIKSKLKKI